MSEPASQKRARRGIRPEKETSTVRKDRRAGGPRVNKKKGRKKNKRQGSAGAKPGSQGNIGTFKCSKISIKPPEGKGVGANKKEGNLCFGSRERQLGALRRFMALGTAWMDCRSDEGKCQDSVPQKVQEKI